MPVIEPLRSILARALLAGLCVANAAWAAEDYKIGVINPERILREAAPAKDAARRIEDEFKSREAAFVKLEQEFKEESARFERDGPTLSEMDRSARRRDVEARGRDVERTRRELAEDLKARQFDEMNKIKERLDALLTKLAKEQGYDLILQDGVFVGRRVDITDEVIKALGSSP